MRLDPASIASLTRRFQSHNSFVPESSHTVGDKSSRPAATEQLVRIYPVFKSLGRNNLPHVLSRDNTVP
jgi:hypothetical protein